MRPSKVSEPSKKPDKKLEGKIMIVMDDIIGKHEDEKRKESLYKLYLAGKHQQPTKKR